VGGRDRAQERPVGEQVDWKQHRHVEGVAAEHVANRKVKGSHPHGSDGGHEFGQRGARGNEDRADEGIPEPRMLGDLAGGRRDEGCRDEDDQRGDREPRDRCSETDAAPADLGRALARNRAVALALALGCHRSAHPLVSVHQSDPEQIRDGDRNAPDTNSTEAGRRARPDEDHHAHQRREHHGEKAGQRVRPRDLGEHRTTAGVHEIGDREDEQVEETRPEEVAHRDVVEPTPHCADVHRELRQRSRAREQDRSHEEPAETRECGDPLCRARKESARDDHERGRDGELND
jgi:hypothetical protein